MKFIVIRDDKDNERVLNVSAIVQVGRYSKHHYRLWYAWGAEIKEGYCEMEQLVDVMPETQWTLTGIEPNPATRRRRLR